MRGPADTPRAPRSATGRVAPDPSARHGGAGDPTRDRTLAGPLFPHPPGDDSTPGREVAETFEALWLRPGRAERVTALSRESIIATAVTLADAEGIEAVSIRKIAALLDARPMSLYSHVGRKQDLLALMVDEAMRSCLVPGELPANWRDAIFLIAQHLRDGARRHPWIFAVAGEQAPISPNAVRHFEQSLQALSELDIHRERKLDILVAIDTYVVGAVVHELGNAGAARPTDREPGAPGKLRLARPYLTRLLDRGDYPHISAFGLDAVIEAHDGEGESSDRRFAQGLHWLLDGIAASLAAD